MVRVSDYIIKFFENNGVKHAFLVTGGGAMFLNDSLAKNKNIHSIFNHHEQACAMAAVAYSKLSGNIPLVMTSTGCGSTNAITGLLDAWQDSNKVFFISGNVNTKETTACCDIPLRKFGIQEANIVKIVEPITKYSVMVTDKNTISYHLEKALYLCNNGRLGPVWVDVPLDIQNSNVEEDDLIHFVPEKFEEVITTDYIDEISNLLSKSKKPIVIAGYGVHLSNTREELLGFIEKHNIPITFTYPAIDLIPSNHKLNIGRLGVKGDRAGNFAVHRSDLILVLGSSLSVATTGFKYDSFAANAKIIVVDIDKNEHRKNTVKISKVYNKDLKEFFSDISSLNYKSENCWTDKCLNWKEKWPVYQEDYTDTSKGINIYYFINKLSEQLMENTAILADAGSAYYCTSQAIKLGKTHRYIIPFSQAEMGFALPGSIGVFFSDSEKNIVVITGDGSLQMNIQELQTVVNYSIPVKIFVLNNLGYLSIRNTMDKFFDSRYLGTGKESGLTFPNLEKISNSYGISYHGLHSGEDLNKIKSILESRGPAIVEVFCLSKQEIIPSSSSKENSEGHLVSQPLDNMYPFLDYNELV